jgi:hypothetical protein
MYLDHGPTEKRQKIIPDKKLLDVRAWDPFLPHPSELGEPPSELGAPMPQARTLHIFSSHGNIFR